MLGICLVQKSVGSLTADEPGFWVPRYTLLIDIVKRARSFVFHWWGLSLWLARRVRASTLDLGLEGAYFLDHLLTFVAPFNKLVVLGNFWCALSIGAFSPERRILVLLLQFLLRRLQTANFLAPCTLQVVGRDTWQMIDSELVAIAAVDLVALTLVFLLSLAFFVFSPFLISAWLNLCILVKSGCAFLVTLGPVSQLVFYLVKSIETQRWLLLFFSLVTLQ